MNPLPLPFALPVLLLLSSCATPGEYKSGAEAAHAVQAHHSQIERIRALGTNYEELWYDKAAFARWKQYAIPVLKDCGVTSAALHYHGFDDRLGQDGEFGNIEIFPKSIYSDVAKLGPGEATSGFYQVPGRYKFAHQGQGRSLRTSRGRCVVRGVPMTIYSFDIYGRYRNYWLTCTFWVPE